MAEYETDAMVQEFLSMLGIDPPAPRSRVQVPVEEQFQYSDVDHIMHHVRDQFGNWLGDLFEKTNTATVLLGPAGPGDHLNVKGECDHQNRTVTVTVSHDAKPVARLTFEMFPDDDREY